MTHLYTSLVLLLLFCSLWPSDGKTFMTYLGTRCIEDCKSNEGEYKCKTIDKYGDCQEMYCSPEENMDYRDRHCSANTFCEKHGKDYYWCRIDSVDWGYCGLVMDDKKHYGSSYGSLCYDDCDQRDYDYYWCHTAHGWDYCSPYENTDYMNKQCRDDSPCGKHNYNYYWCKLKEGSWGYCGVMEPKLFLQRSMYHHVCTDQCQYHESGDYYWCHTTNGWDYCSPDVDVTYKGKSCRSDHSCGSHEYSYNWCWTSGSEYDYCGPIESGECTYIISRHRNKRALGNSEMICNIGNKKKITFTSELAPYDIINGNPWKKEAKNLISRWDNGYLVDMAHSNLIHSDDLRIVMQGTISRNNQPHYNLLIQVNVKQRTGQSITVSQVIVPRGIPRRYIRRAFLESFTKQARVFIDVSTANQC